MFGWDDGDGLTADHMDVAVKHCEVGCCNISDSVKKILKKSVPAGNVTYRIDENIHGKK